MVLPRDRITASAPLVTKPVVKKKKYQPMHKGMPLQIEGMPQYSSMSVRFPTSAERGEGDTTPGLLRAGFLGESRKVKKEHQLFQMKQAARARITPIADPLSGVSDRRRRAARQRMRGRLGTMLSERETLS